MRAVQITTAIGLALLACACSTQPEATQPDAAQPEALECRAEEPTTVAASFGAGEGPTGEAASDLNGWGVACRAACWGLGAAGCAAVGATCAAGTAVTIGGVSIPCTVATITACGAAGGAASACSDWCTAQFPEALAASPSGGDEPDDSSW